MFSADGLSTSKGGRSLMKRWSRHSITCPISRFSSMKSTNNPIAFNCSPCTVISDARDSRLDGGIAGHRERKLVNNHAAQLLALHVHALPERRGRKEHAMGCAAELLEQRVARAGTLQ